jgi:hypothetical protein
VPNGQPYPGAWTFAYPVTPPTAQYFSAETAAPVTLSAAALISSPTALETPTLDVSAAEPSLSASSSLVEKPKFFELKPVAQSAVAVSVVEPKKSVEPVAEQPVEAEPLVQTAEAEVVLHTEEAEPSEEVVEASSEQLGEPEVSEEQVESDESDEGPRFEISPALVSEPQTNSIVIAQPEDPLSGEFFVDEGHFVRTGSIEIVPTQTGEISIVSETSEADLADESDAASNFISAIAPVTASEVMNSRESIAILPKSGKRAKDSSSTSLTLMISIFVVATLATIAYFFGFFG